MFSTYPKIDIYDVFTHERLGTTRTITFQTCVRKEFEGKYYLIPHHKVYYIDEGSSRTKDECYTEFITEVYMTIMFYKIDLSIINPINGEPVVRLDEDQQPELKRLNPIAYEFLHDRRQ